VRFALLIGLLLALAACNTDLTSSGRYPNVRVLSDVLTPTAGPPVSVSDNWATTESFTAHNPPGWAIETAPASRAPAITYRQGPCTSITVAPYPHPAAIPEACRDAPLRVVLRGVKIAGQTILIIGQSPPDEWAAVEPVFAAVAASVRAP
jgi:hypothetical protein